MNILILSKRFYTGKDLISDRYGRTYAFSNHLATLNNQVLGIALDYRAGSQLRQVSAPHNDANPDWNSIGINPNLVGGLMRYSRLIEELAEKFRPDVVVSASDCFHIILGGFVARKFDYPHVADLYDNFESFSASRIPGIRTMFRKTLASANGVCCVSTELKQHISRTCRPTMEPVVITNAIDKHVFSPGDKKEARSFLNLPLDRTLIGTGGALNKNRGIATLFSAFDRLKMKHPEMDLVLAGPIGRGIKIPNDQRVHYLGELDYRQMPALFNALDIGVICNLDSPFGRYCFPQKFYEMAACKLPIVSASVGAIRPLLQDRPETLFNPASVDGLCKAITFQLQNPYTPNLHIPSWEEQSLSLHRLLLSVTPS